LNNYSSYCCSMLFRSSLCVDFYK